MAFLITTKQSVKAGLLSMIKYIQTTGEPDREAMVKFLGMYIRDLDRLEDIEDVSYILKSQKEHPEQLPADYVEMGVFD